MKLTAIDTETIGGSAKVITTPDIGFTCDSFESCVDPLLEHYNKYTFVMWNMAYDCQAILKYLPDHNINELIDNNETFYKEYKIKYIARKYMNIYKDKKTYISKGKIHTHWKQSMRCQDIAQFYDYLSLDNAGKQYLNERKINSYITQQITTESSKYSDEELEKIFKDNINEIMEYCQQDSTLTLKLAYKIIADVKNIFDLNIKSFVSKAIIGKMLTRRHVGYKEFIGEDGKKIKFLKYPKFHGEYKSALYARASYHGGIFDMKKKGSFGKMTDIDISSGYPSNQYKMPNWNKGNFIAVDNVYQIKDEDYYGWVLCKFDYPLIPFTSELNNEWISILDGFEHHTQTKNSRKFYPDGERIQIITLVEYRFLKKYGYDVQLNKGYVWRPKHNYTGDDIDPFNWIPDIYQKKQDIKKEFGKDDYKYSLVKIPINGSYGITCQNIGQAEFRNYFYASYITAETRVQICEVLEELDLYDKYITIATDGILIEGHIDIPDKYTQGGLGSWDVEYWDSGIVVANGIYQLEKEGKKSKIAVRGMLSFDGDLKESIIKNKDKAGFYPAMKGRPLTMYQGMRYKKYSKDDINRFIVSGRLLNCESDISKSWIGINNFNDLLKNNFTGKRMKLINGEIPVDNSLEWIFNQQNTKRGSYIKGYRLWTILCMA